MNKSLSNLCFFFSCPIAFYQGDFPEHGWADFLEQRQLISVRSEEYDSHSPCSSLGRGGALPTTPASDGLPLCVGLM